MPEQPKLEKDDFLQKLKKVVRMVLYGPAISQSDCRKAGPYQLKRYLGQIISQSDCMNAKPNELTATKKYSYKRLQPTK